MMLVFFDIDGTLLVPRYKVNDQYVVGFTDEGWRKFCETKKEHGYDDCIPVQPTFRYARKRKEEGAKLYVLSTAQSSGEIAAKKYFFETRYGDLFDEVITVPADAEKLVIIRKMAEEAGIPLSMCELVEDTYSTILKANDAGIVATHISKIVCDM